MGIIALVTLGGCGLAGWILGQLFRIFAQCSRYWPTGQRPPGCRRPDRAALGSDPGADCPGLGRKGWLCRTASRDCDVCRECQCQGGPDRVGRGPGGRQCRAGDRAARLPHAAPSRRAAACPGPRACTLDAQSGRASRPVRDRRCRGGRLGRQGPRQLRRDARGRAAPRGLAGPAPLRGIMPEMRAARSRPGSSVLRLPVRGRVSRTVPDSSAQSSSTRDRS